MLVVNGWTVCAHPLFLDQLERLTAAVDREKARNPGKYRESANAKLLFSLRELVFRTIAADPTRPAYRLGNTLGQNRRHWFRAKFGGQRFRLFFRFDSNAKVIIFGWVNDQTSLRAYGSRTDAYAVFQRMLDGGNPPDDWAALLQAASEDQPRSRLTAARGSEEE